MFRTPRRAWRGSGMRDAALTALSVVSYRQVSRYRTDDLLPADGIARGEQSGKPARTF
jgi:hypothetical protein